MSISGRMSRIWDHLRRNKWPYLIVTAVFSCQLLQLIPAQCPRSLTEGAHSTLETTQVEHNLAADALEADWSRDAYQETIEFIERKQTRIEELSVPPCAETAQTATMELLEAEIHAIELKMRYASAEDIAFARGVIQERQHRYFELLSDLEDRFD